MCAARTSCPTTTCGGTSRSIIEKLKIRVRSQPQEMRSEECIVLSRGSVHAQRYSWDHNGHACTHAQPRSIYVYCIVMPSSLDDEERKTLWKGRSARKGCTCRGPSRWLPLVLSGPLLENLQAWHLQPLAQQQSSKHLQPSEPLSASVETRH